MPIGVAYVQNPASSAAVPTTDRNVCSSLTVRQSESLCISARRSERRRCLLIPVLVHVRHTFVSVSKSLTTGFPDGSS